MSLHDEISEINRFMDSIVTVKWYPIGSGLNSSTIETKWYGCIHYNKELFENNMKPKTKKYIQKDNIDDAVQLMQYYVKEEYHNDIQQNIKDLHLAEKDNLFVIFYTLT